MTLLDAINSQTKTSGIVANFGDTEPDMFG